MVGVCSFIGNFLTSVFAIAQFTDWDSDDGFIGITIGTFMLSMITIRILYVWFGWIPETNLDILKISAEQKTAYIESIKDFNWSCIDLYSRVNLELLSKQVSAWNGPILVAASIVKVTWIWAGCEAVIFFVGTYCGCATGTNRRR